MNTPGTTEPLTSASAWLAAARPHTLPAAVVPVMVAGGLASKDGVFRWDAFLWAMVGSLCIQIAANFANDVSDANRGADPEDRLGPQRMVSTGVLTARQMWTGVAIASGVAAISGVALSLISSPWILVVGVVSLLAMLGYVGGPAPYGYRGLGELFVFVFFGLVATVTARYVHDLAMPVDVWLLAIPVGMLVTAILVANNYRDIETDARVGKRTLAVKIGRERTQTFFAILVLGAFVLIVVFGALGWTPRATMFAGFLAPQGVRPVRTLQKYTEGPALIRVLKTTARLHFWTGMVLAAGAAITL